MIKLTVQLIRSCMSVCVCLLTRPLTSPLTNSRDISQKLPRDDSPWKNSPTIPYNFTLDNSLQLPPEHRGPRPACFLCNYTVSQKSSPFYFCDYSVNCWPILIIFSTIAAEEICSLMTYSFLIISSLSMNITE